MSTPIDIGSMITRSPEIRGGRPRIAGTGITVQRIASWYKRGVDPDEIAEQISHLTIAQVYAALTYYHANRAEIDADIERDLAITVALEKERGIDADTRR